MDTQVLFNATEYAEVYEDGEGGIRLYMRGEDSRKPQVMVAVDVAPTPRQARHLARLLLQFADDAESRDAA